MHLLSNNFVCLQKHITQNNFFSHIPMKHCGVPFSFLLSFFVEAGSGEKVSYCTRWFSIKKTLWSWKLKGRSRRKMLKIILKRQETVKKKREQKKIDFVLSARHGVLFTFMMIDTQTFTIYTLQLQKQKVGNLQKQLTSR